MTRKPNLAKFMLGLCVLALLFIGTWATTRSPLASAKKIAVSPPAASNSLGSRYAAPLAPAGTDAITGVFELEGDIADSPAGPPDDWVTVNCDGGTADVKTGVLHDGLGTSIFTGGGSKDPELLASWKHKNGSVPDKDEIINAYAAKYTGSPNGDDILVFGADRYDNSGTAFIGFWFFSSPVFAAADGKFRTGPLASDPLAAHAVGDILIIVEFSNGGAVATAKVLEWVGTGGSESSGTLNDITATAPLGSVFSVSNGSPVTIPTTGSCPASWQYTPKGGSPGGAIPTNAFFEGGINLDAFPALTGACFSSFMVETRSSVSVTATLKDFVLGQFNTCVSFTCGKVVAPTSVCEGTPVEYTYTFNNTGGIAVTVDLSDDKLGSLYTGHSVPIGATDTFVSGGHILLPGTTVNNATFTVHSAGQPDRTCPATASVTVHENPTAVVSGDNSYCDTNVHLVTIQAALTGTGPWNLTWSDGVTQTGVTTSPATRQVNPSSTTTYTVTAVSDAFCSGTASGSATITVNPSPSVDQPGNQILCNGASTSLVTFTGSAGATFGWTNNNTSIGLAASGTGNIAAFTATNSGTTNVVATITVTPTSGDGCVGPSKNFTITVKPTPTVAICIDPTEAASCSADEDLLLKATVSPAAGTVTYSWTKVGDATVLGTGPTLLVTAPGTYRVDITRDGCGAFNTTHVGLCAGCGP
jgi:hypothetical protein